MASYGSERVKDYFASTFSIAMGNTNSVRAATSL